jgi:hypothetical protein
MPTLAVWIAAIGYGCFADWVSLGPDGVRMALRCFTTARLLGIEAPPTLLAIAGEVIEERFPTPSRDVRRLLFVPA